MNRLTALRIQHPATATIVLTKLRSISGSELQLRSDAVQIALQAHQLDFKPVIRVARMGIAIKPVGALRAGAGVFRADAVLDHQIKETIVVIICPTGSLVSGEIVL